MKHLNVLLVTYSFPPAGGVGVLRRRKPGTLLTGSKESGLTC
jgi:hypothetical protein